MDNLAFLLNARFLPTVIQAKTTNSCFPKSLSLPAASPDFALAFALGCIISHKGFDFGSVRMMFDF